MLVVVVLSMLICELYLQSRVFTTRIYIFTPDIISYKRNKLDLLFFTSL